jgi:membrane protease YdiL (CAAX protease family)
MTVKQAWLLVAAGLVLEGPIRWLVRPDMGHLVAGSLWFNLPLRLGIEAGFVACLLLAATIAGVRVSALGVLKRRWTRWEWIAFAIVGGIEMTIVVSVAGGRWPHLLAAGVLGKALLWATGEFLFGFNQESGFRGIMMSGLLRLTGPVRATLLNTLVFTVGPLHGPALLRSWQRDPESAMWWSAGVIMTGLFFSWLRYRTDNVILAGTLHGVVNGFLNGSGLATRGYL